MILRQDEVARHLAEGAKQMNESSFCSDNDPLVINPFPALKESSHESAGAIDLRLGTWFLSFKKDHSESLRIAVTKSEARTANLTKTQYVPFHRSYYLHPHSFVLAVTLEWIRLPKTLAGYVIGKSSWGRRGLIIATAVGVHPRFSGCLTLELSNIGEVPIEIRPGMSICQLFLHTVLGCDNSNLPGSTNHMQIPSSAGTSIFSGSRLPRLGEICMDEDPIATALQKKMPLFENP